MRIARRVALVLPLAVMAGVVTAGPALARGSTGDRWSPFPRPAAKPALGTNYVPTRAAPLPAPASHRPAAPVWPAAASGLVALDKPGSRVRVPGQPLSVSAPATDPGNAPRSLRAATLSHAQAQAAGVDGVLLSLSRGDGRTGTGRVAVRVSYGPYAEAFGGGYAARLRLVALPACALTTPSVPACRVQSPVLSTMDNGDQTLDADVAVPGAGNQALLATASTPAGPDGNYAAAALNPAGSWSAGGSSGGFSYQVPIPLPPSVGGAAPSLALSYDSQAVDGKTSMQNAQASVVGDGWDLGLGSITWSYQDCGRDGLTGSGDQCWAGNVASISLGGHSGQLVFDGSKTNAQDRWHISGDDGSQVELLTGATNDTYNGAFWRVTTTDGTQYYFGQNHLPGGDGSDPAANSVLTVPVYCPQSADPCHAAGWAQMGYQWDLDYVVDPNGNLTEYAYTREPNYYSRGAGQNNGNGTLTQYQRAGYVSQIAYGLRLADQVAAKGKANAPARVVFTPGERCVVIPNVFDCASSKLATNPSKWPDVPYDQNCNANSTCKNVSPTFWSTKRLATIQSQVLVGSAYQNVDKWTLSQSLPATGNPDGMSTAVLQLDSVTRDGQDTLGLGADTPMQPISFGYKEIDNRVDGLVPAAPPLYRPRLTTIQNEIGGSVAVTYYDPACSRVNKTMPASPDSNTMPCFPAWWTPQNETSPIQDWFQKVLVHTVTGTDGTTGDPGRATTYLYPPDAAWHRDDSPITDPKQRTWDQWRGYGQVIVETGSSPDPVTETETTYLRGMDGDYKSDGSRRSVSVATFAGAVTDANHLQGTQLETQTFTKAGGTVVGDTVSIPWLPTGPTASESFAGLPAAEAWQAGTAKTVARSMLANGSWRTTETDNAFDPAYGGRQVSTDNKGDTALVGTASSQEVCTLTSYATSSGRLWQYPDERKTIDGPCTAPPTAANTVSDALSYYDQPANGTNLGTFGTVAKGNVTGVANLDHYDSSGNPQYTPVKSTTFDPYGRPVAQTDLVAGATTTTTPSPATGALPTTVTTTGPVSGWSTITTLDPARNVPLSKTDLNGNVTSMTYDGLGRLTQVWKPGWSKASHATKPSQIFSYFVAGSGKAPTYTESQVLREDQSYSIDVKILDGFGAERQEQTSTADGSTGRTVSGVWYDSHGWVEKSAAPQPNPQGGPSGAALLTIPDDQIANETVTTYDGQGRATVSQFVSYGVNQWATTSAYPGADETDTTAPAGGTGYSLFTDARGNTVRRVDYSGNKPTGTGLTTTYTFTADGRPLGITDAGGATWAYGYDPFGASGHRSTVTDPDTGTTTSIVDNDGRLSQTTDARGQVLTYRYDPLGRKTGVFDGSTQLAGWTYDTVGKDELASSVRYQTVNGTTYQYVNKVDGYTPTGKPTGVTVVVPTVGDSTVDRLAGSYDTTYGYTPVTGLLDHTNYPAVGGLPAETVYDSYTRNGQLTELSGNSDYLTFAQYSATGQLQGTMLGDSPHRATQVFTYDAATGRVIEVDAKVENQTTVADASTYTYNPAGDLTSAKDLRDGTTTDLQCYGYDGYQRLTQVWTDPGAQQSTQGGNTVDGIGGCAATGPTEGNQGTGPAPYWQTYTYDNTGNRLTEVDHDTSGQSTNDVTRKSDYANPGQATWPAHGLASVTSSGGPATGQNTYRYDAAGNTTARTLSSGQTETLTWDQEGHLKQDATNGGTVGYLYDADGNTLLRKDSGQHQTTLYLPGQEAYLNTVSQAVTASRMLSAPGGATIVEQSTGSTWYDLADPQGTATIEVNAATLAISRRTFTPWGAPRGAAPSAWADDHTFLGKSADATTGLVDVGARQYDPTLGRFISVDPVLETTDPRQMGGYAYAGDNPTTHADPSGLMRPPPDSDSGPDSLATSMENDAFDRCASSHCFNSVVHQFSNPMYVANLEVNAINRAYAAGVAQEKADAARKAQQHHHWWQAAASFVYHASGLSDVVDCVTDPSVSGCAKAAITVVTVVGTGGESAVADIGVHMVEDLGEDAATQVVKDGLEDTVATASSEGASRAGAQSATDASADVAQDAGPVACHSFAGTTPVVLADGSTKPIKDVRLGDKVRATDPVTGATTAQPVTALHDNHDNDLADVTVASASGTVSTVHTTWHHPFWDATHHRWTEAARLAPGTELSTGDVVLAVRTWFGTQDMNDLTVATTHTYYIIAGATPVLVHNCGDIHVSPMDSDWATKGAHVHIGGNEVRVFPNGEGGIGASPVRLSNGRVATSKQVQRVLDCLETCAPLRNDLASKASAAMDEMNHGNWGNSLNRAAEMNFLIKALNRMGRQE
jgi:RHS repeat-associated protein